MPAILHPLPKIVKKFNTITFTGGTVRFRLRLLACDSQDVNNSVRAQPCLLSQSGAIDFTLKRSSWPQSGLFLGTLILDIDKVSECPCINHPT
jgi:hypothetical protein